MVGQLELSLRRFLVCAGLGCGLGLTLHAGQVEARRLTDKAAPAAQKLSLRSTAAIIQDQETGEILFAKNVSAIAPIASITKLMTAMVVLDADPDLSEVIAISVEDIDLLRGTRSRLQPGAALTRDELLRLALMASENRAASALGRSFPGGIAAFTAAMNHKAQMLGMNDSRFGDATGLSSANVSSAEDLAKLVRAAHRYPLISRYTTLSNFEVYVGGRPLVFRNTNRLVVGGSWEIGLSKTGFTNDAGRCLVLQARLAERQVIIILLDSWGKLSRIGDAVRIRKWLEASARSQAGAAQKAAQKVRVIAGPPA